MTHDGQGNLAERWDELGSLRKRSILIACVLTDRGRCGGR